jgi:CheY-like chemotaxis protein
MAEDNRLIRESISIILREAGYLVDTAENGAAAVEKHYANEYDVILMDCQMPIMDGFEATTRIRTTENSSNRVPIIAFTGHDLLDHPLNYIEYGMDGFLPKPVDPNLLIQTVRQAARQAIFSPIAC